MKISLKTIFPVWLKNSVKFLVLSEFRNAQIRHIRERLELKRLQELPRYVKSCFVLPEYSVEFVDAASFLSMYDEIMKKGIYRFCSQNNSAPYIIDCGANIGLSIFYFKKIFPQARIVGFEPDPEIFKTLKKNIINWRLDNIELREAAVWKNEEPLSFLTDGADGGRICSGSNAVKIMTVRLRDYLEEPVDFLKIDIEGAELEVLIDCSDRLCNVQNLFVEYHSESAQPQKLDILLANIHRAGFRYRIQNSSFCGHPFCESETNNRFDMQLNIFAFRIK